MHETLKINYSKLSVKKATRKCLSIYFIILKQIFQMTHPVRKNYIDNAIKLLFVNVSKHKKPLFLSTVEISKLQVFLPSSL